MPRTAKFARLENPDNVTSSEALEVFDGIHIYILPTSIGNARCNIFRRETTNLGGVIDDDVTSETTHVLIDESVTGDRMCKILKWNEPPPHIKIVQTRWLSNCIKARARLASEDFELNVPRNSNSDALNNTLMSPEVSSTSAAYYNEIYTQEVPKTKESYLCSLPSSNSAFNYNKHITDKFAILAESYRSTGDNWRAASCEKAIVVLKNFPKQVKTRKEALMIKGIGESLADKIDEILGSGNLRKISEMESDKRSASLKLLTNVMGVGPTTAQVFVQQGIYTLKDLKEKVKLTKAQQIGLKYYEELQDRIPRSEATEIFNMAKCNIHILLPEACIEACGSYRRNRNTCGDIDILVGHSSEEPPKALLQKMVKLLHQIGLLTDDISTTDEEGATKKYMGICKLPGNDKKHRRIDIFLIPLKEYACQLMHLTGSAIFNRSIRLYAMKKNMSLSEHCLRANVVRHGGQKITIGHIVPTPTEESIFEALGLVYQPPHQRDHFAIE